MVIFIFPCYSLKSSHSLLPPLYPQICSLSPSQNGTDEPVCRAAVFYLKQSRYPVCSIGQSFLVTNDKNLTDAGVGEKGSGGGCNWEGESGGSADLNTFLVQAAVCGVAQSRK